MRADKEWEDERDLKGEGKILGRIKEVKVRVVIIYPFSVLPTFHSVTETPIRTADWVRGGGGRQGGSVS